MATIENKSTLFHWNKIQSGITTDFEEVAPILTQGSILAGNPANDGMPVAVTSTDIGKILKIISDDNGGVKVSWEAQDAGHSQNTDIGTSNSTFYIGGDTGVKLGNNDGDLWVRTFNNYDYSGVRAKTLNVSQEGGYVLLPTAAPSADYHAVHKKWVLDQLGATAGGLIFKGTADSAASMPITYQVGDLYRSGFVGVFLTHAVEVGDWIAAVNTRTEGTPVPDDWAVWQGNIYGAVSADSTLTTGLVIVGDGTKKVRILDSPTSPANKVLISNAIGKAQWSSTVKYENPMTAAGDIVVGGTDGEATRLPKGAEGTALKIVDGVPAWGADLTYTHPDTPGNIHLPAGGGVKQMLQWSAAGTAKWIDVSGDVTVADGGATVIGDQKVGFSKIVNSAAAGLSILGRPLNTAGSFSEIASDNDGDVMRRSGNTLGFGRILTNSLELNETAFNPTVAGFVGQVIVTKDWLYRCHTAGVGADKWKRIPFASFTI